MFYFYAVPVYALVKRKGQKDSDERLAPPDDVDAFEALKRVEFRDSWASQKAETMLTDSKGAVIFAQPPNDLPALLRTADQLLAMSKQDIGEHSRVWRCDCGCHYAVPTALVRPVAIRCDRCGRTLELEVGKSLSNTDPAIDDDGSKHLARSRLQLSEFFREAMARGWPVLVTREAPKVAAG